MLEVLHLKVVGEGRTLARLDQRPLQALDLLLLLQLLDLLRQVHRMLEQVDVREAITIRYRHNMIAIYRQFPREVAILRARDLRRLVRLLLVSQQHVLLQFRHVLLGLVLRVCQLHQGLSVADGGVLNVASIRLLLQQLLLILLAHLLLDRC